jgi:hypothetical protein
VAIHHYTGQKISVIKKKNSPMKVGGEIGETSYAGYRCCNYYNHAILVRASEYLHRQESIRTAIRAITARIRALAPIPMASAEIGNSE